MARRYPIHRDELESAAMLGLVRAASGYNSEKGVFDGYAKVKIACAIQDEIRLSLSQGMSAASLAVRRRAKIDVVSIYKSRHGLKVIAEGKSSPDRTPEEIFDAKDEADAMLRCIPARERDAVIAVVGHGLTQCKYAEMKGVSRSLVSRRVNDGLMELRDQASRGDA